MSPCSKRILAALIIEKRRILYAGTDLPPTAAKAHPCLPIEERVRLRERAICGLEAVLQYEVDLVAPPMSSVPLNPKRLANCPLDEIDPVYPFPVFTYCANSSISPYIEMLLRHNARGPYES